MKYAATARACRGVATSRYTANAEPQMSGWLQRAMAAQAEAERERRAKIVHAEGELQASQKLAEAGKIIGAEPTTLQLRYLQTLTQIATEKTNILVFPLPLEILSAFIPKERK